MDVMYDSERRVLRLMLRGEWPRSYDQQLRRTIKTMGVPVDAPLLIDVRAVQSGTEPHYDELAGQSDQEITRWQRRAFLVRGDVQYGVARIIQATAPVGVEVEVFTDEEEALAWLVHI